MRTGKITVNGKEYILCFSARVIRACIERYGALEKIDDVLSGKDTLRSLDESFWILAQMMQAGERYAEMEGLDHHRALTADELYDTFDAESMEQLKWHIASTMSAGAERHVETEDAAPKNAAATRRKSVSSGTSGTACASD